MLKECRPPPRPPGSLSTSTSKESRFYSRPPEGEYTINVLAVSGLGSHPFGSFVHKGDRHMWLSDSLPRHMPTARVMIYGYESGLQDSTSFAGLDDLASSLHLDICRLLRSGEQKQLVFIGHSLGGSPHQALIRMAESGSEADLVMRIFGGLFFGVPNDGMDIESLIPIVGDQPNRSLLESLSAINSQILRLQKKDFSSFLNQMKFELFCFYETKLSLTAARVSYSHLSRNSGTNIVIELSWTMEDERPSSMPC